ncbi:MAG TPA: hypothetical protein VGD59_09150 [Acidisarcina sp.]
MINEERIASALEAAPAVTLPPDFTARVMSNLPVRAALPRARTNFGRTALSGSLVLLFCALLGAFLLNSQHGSLAATLVEWTSLVQLAGVTLWLSLRSRELHS